MAGSNQVNLNESRVTPSSFLSSTSAIRTFPYFPSVPKLLSTFFFFFFFWNFGFASCFIAHVGLPTKRGSWFWFWLIVNRLKDTSHGSSKFSGLFLFSSFFHFCTFFLFLSCKPCFSCSGNLKTLVGLVYFAHLLSF